MSDIALRVEGLGKQYRLGLEQSTGGFYRYKSLRDSFGSFARRPLSTLRSAVVRPPMSESNSFWAVRDVSFEVGKGEVVGIIGRNGAGKSTLLKLLSRITKPTKGRIDLFGRVGSLLEVGTGFHPELTGRENIFLNGAILGMTRAEVRGKFDEIVAFSEIERFLDTPVKQYSSGMYTRLAFAVAAHLEPEILVVDEVLAVGDAVFQEKCLGKMKDVAGHGRTVLFVSHNMAAVQSLCQRCVVLSQGRTRFIGQTSDAVAEYLAAGGRRTSQWSRTGTATGDVQLRDVSVRVEYAEGRALLHTTVSIATREARKVSLDIRVTDILGTPVCFAGVGSANPVDEVRLTPPEAQVTVTHDVTSMVNGTYQISVEVAQTMIAVLDGATHCVEFELEKRIPPGHVRAFHLRDGFGPLTLPYLGASVAAPR